MKYNGYVWDMESDNFTIRAQPFGTSTSCPSTVNENLNCGLSEMVLMKAEKSS